MEDDVVVNSEVTIPRSELTYRATRAGGPGGQHVNTSSTKVELSWDVSGSPSITDEQRTRIAEKLATRIAEDGVLRLTSAGSRSQHQNKEDVTERFGKMIAQALHKPKPRRKTKPSRASKEARLKSKKKRSETKSRRGPVGTDE
jgi:ribosome-associated protein